MLAAFLDRIALVSDVDSWSEQGGVTLMTLHSAKGLEFPVVALPGLEDGLLPHFNAQKGDEDLEEERRLLYVGMTRARERLILSTCQRRRIAGRYQDQQPSPFLEEIPAELVEVTESPDRVSRVRTSAAAAQSFFRRGTGSYGAPPRRRSPDPSIEYDLDADDGEGGPLRKGTRVRHPTLGPGRILELDGSGDTMKITAFFDRAGKRKLVAKYANLEVL